jgi:para-nitrobenzyl esterase
MDCEACVDHMVNNVKLLDVRKELTMSVIVETNKGKVEGLQQDGLLVFKGIPYGAPPVGERRWLPPQAVERWVGVLQAKAFGNNAPQNAVPKEIAAVLPVLDVPGPQSEDCLYLNLWTPNLDDIRRPVMVWIHGGGFTLGAASQQGYEGDKLAKRGDVVVVTINYRLGPFGFLNLNEVTKGRIPATGNEGLLDQIAALEWVRDNIAAFGGDPNNVTIFGESAGGTSVAALLTMPMAKGLFQKAILQSGTNPGVRLDRAARISERFLKVLNLKPDDIQALRTLSMEQWLVATSKLANQTSPDPEIGMIPLQPVVDGKVISRAPLDMVADGSADGVTVMAGTNLEEFKLFLPMDKKAAALDEPSLVARLSPDFSLQGAQSLIKGYQKAHAKRGAPTTPVELFSAIRTDQIFRMPAVRLVEALSRRRQPAYNYLFTWPSPHFGGLLGSCHAVEIGFVFGTYADTETSKAFNGYGPTADTLSKKMQSAWLAFARTGNPNPSGEPGLWPTYGEKRATMIFGEQFRVEEAPYEEERRAWEGIPNTALKTT